MHRQAGKVVALVCHGACVRLKTRPSSGHLVGNGRAPTELANSEEAFADWLVGRMIQPFRIEEGAWRLPDTNFVLSGIFTSSRCATETSLQGISDASEPPLIPWS
jgi:hypothetical protein